MDLEVKFKKAVKNARIPSRAKDSDAGYDLFACDRLVIQPMERKLVPLGICIEIPEGYYGRIAPRSGLALRDGIDVLAGVVDSGYRSEIGVVLINLNLPETIYGSSPSYNAYGQMFGSVFKFEINAGDRIAQLIIEKCHSVNWVDSELSESDRGAGGFGSTGV